MIELTSIPAALAGVASHLAYFIRGEHHREGPRLLLIYFFTYLATSAYFQRYFQFSLPKSLTAASLIMASYFSGLFTSMLVYRVFFHRLGRFKGPPIARLTNLYHSWKVRGLDNYKYINRLHQEYGSIVRTGPSNLSIIIPEAVAVVHGPDSRCMKSAWYDQSLPLESLHGARDRRAHDKRRRVWSKGFSPSALQDYEKRVVKYTRELLDRLSSFSGEPVNASKWFNFYSFDVMGDLAFGSPFDMLKSGERHWALELLEEGMKPMGFFTPIPWMVPILSRIPGAAKGYNQFIDFCSQQARRRMKMKVDTPDIMSWLLQKHEKGPKTPTDLLWIDGDSRLAIVAGSDTTAAALTFLFYHLAKEPEHIEKLRTELTPLLEQGVSSDRTVQSAEYLNGAINETLRLHPPVPSGFPRLTPPEGVTIGETYIPGIPRSRCRIGLSATPKRSIPGLRRWSSSPDLLPHKEAFAPFSIGPFACIGKQLALMEVRTVATQILMRYDVSLAPGENGRELLEKTKDYTTLGLGELFLQFTPRKEAETV